MTKRRCGHDTRRQPGPGTKHPLICGRKYRSGKLAVRRGVLFDGGEPGFGFPSRCRSHAVRRLRSRRDALAQKPLAVAPTQLRRAFLSRRT
jgi:hypothetical protein